MDGDLLSRKLPQAHGSVPEESTESNMADVVPSSGQSTADDGFCPTIRPPTPLLSQLTADSAEQVAGLSSTKAQAPSSLSTSASILALTMTSAGSSESSATGQARPQAHAITLSPSPSRSSVASSPNISIFNPGSHLNGALSLIQPSAESSSWSVRAKAFQSLKLQTDSQGPANTSVSLTTWPQPDPAALSSAPQPGITTTPASSYIRPSSLALQHKSSSASLKPVSRTPSLKTTGFHGYGTASAASSTVASPIISAMGDVTPLPSPLLSGDSPGPWKKYGRSPPREAPYSASAEMPDLTFVTSNGESFSSALAHHAKRRAYAELLTGNPGRPPEPSLERSELQPMHTRDRSLSEYIPDPLHVPKRMVTVSAMHCRQSDGSEQTASSSEPHMRREPHLSEARGLTPVEQPPTPPPSESSVLLNNGTASSQQGQSGDQNQYEYFEARGREDKKWRRWRSIKLLGQGTFSRVMLATNQISSFGDESLMSRTQKSSVSASQPSFDRSTLVAIKVCEHGPKGGASEDRVEMSLKRELEIMQCIHHPSLVRLKAWNIEPTRAILVLSYCPGGDLFDIASTHRDVLSPRLLGRIFSEIVGAVRYLHGQHIVHRDIKLENVLVNLTPEELADKSIDWVVYPYSVTTLTDLGLSRRVADDVKLETRCGSDDYAAPEVIMGQPYDGRATDAWSLGVLLYALLEGRLPFDPNPGMSDAHRMRSKTSHRIARVEWRWIEFAGEDGDHEGDIKKFRAAGLQGAMEITESLLKRARSRWTIEQVAGTTWVRDALRIKGGLRFREEAEGEEV